MEYGRNDALLMRDWDASYRFVGIPLAPRFGLSIFLIVEANLILVVGM
jgi:hypothetical protein